MDAEWLNRAGILAEAISFLFIAPEIIGRERLQRFESAFERWAGRTIQNPRQLWGRGQIVAFLPGFAGGVSGSLIAQVSVLVGNVGIAFGVNGVAAVIGVTIPRIFWLLYTASLLFGLLGTSLVGLGEKWKLVRLLGYTLSVAAIPAAWLMAFTTTLTFLLLRAMLAAAIGLMAGEGRLRAVVFGTGLILLFGGMGTQFAATF